MKKLICLFLFFIFYFVQSNFAQEKENNLSETDKAKNKMVSNLFSFQTTQYIFAKEPDLIKKIELAKIATVYFDEAKKNYYFIKDLLDPKMQSDLEKFLDDRQKEYLNDVIVSYYKKELSDDLFYKSQLNLQAFSYFSKASFEYLMQKLYCNLNLHSQTSEDYFLNGIAKGKEKNHQGAINDFTKAIELKNDYYEAYNNRGNAKAELGNHKAAIDDFNKAIKIKNNYAEAYYNRGFSKELLKDFEGAILDFNKAIELRNNYAEAYFNRGTAKLLLGNKNNGCEDLKIANELGFSDAYNAIKIYCK